MSNGPYWRSVERFPTLRQSRLATFDRCALSSSFEEEWLSGWSTHDAASGQIFHRFAARALETMYEQGERTLPTDAAVAILDEALRQNDIDKRCPERFCGQPVVRREGGFIYCQNGHRHRSDFVNLPMEAIKDLRWIVVKFANDNAFDIENLVDVEQRLSAPITYPDGKGGAVQRTLTGQLDALFVTGERSEEFVVLDFKSGWGIPGPTSVGFDGYFQQRFYAWLVFKNFPSAEKVTLREFYVRFSEPREATVFRSEIDDVEADLSSLAERFDRAHHEANYPPSPGVHCQALCARPSACPIFPGVRKEGSITNGQQAKRVAKEITVARAALKNRTEALSAWTSVHGPEEVSSHKGKRVWGHKEVSRTSRPSKEEMEKALAAARVGVPIRIDDLYRTAKTSRFELHAPQERDDPPSTADDAALMSALEASIAQANQTKGAA